MDQRMENYVEKGTEIWGIWAQENTELTKKKNPEAFKLTLILRVSIRQNS